MGVHVCVYIHEHVLGYLCECMSCMCVYVGCEQCVHMGMYVGRCEAILESCLMQTHLNKQITASCVHVHNEPHKSNQSTNQLPLPILSIQWTDMVC